MRYPSEVVESVVVSISIDVISARLVECVWNESKQDKSVNELSAKNSVFAQRDGKISSSVLLIVSGF